MCAKTGKAGILAFDHHPRAAHRRGPLAGLMSYETSPVYCRADSEFIVALTFLDWSSEKSWRRSGMDGSGRIDVLRVCEGQLVALFWSGEMWRMRKGMR